MKSFRQPMLRHALFAGASIAALSGWGPVAAQTADGAYESDDTIVVSARRREETLQDVPLAVTAATADELNQIGAVDITSVQRITPNATIEVARGSNSTLIAFIRGVGQQDPLWGFEPGVGVYVDDVFIARPQGAVLDIFDLERIEVLRGPQGTLYGRNTIGGAIKYVTKRMDMDNPTFSARANVGSYGQFDQILSGSVPLGETFAIGGAIANYKRDGYGTNLNTGAEHYNKDLRAYRLSAEWAPTDTFSIRISGDKTEDDSNAKHGHRLLPSADGTVPVTDNVYDTRAGLGDGNKVVTQGASLTAEWDVNDMFTVKSVTAYRESDTVTPIDFDALPEPDFDVPARYIDDQFSQEFQLLFNTDRLSGIAGVYYLDGNASGEFDAVLSALGLSIYTSGDQKKENFSVYADMTYDVTDRLSVSVGGRYTEDETTADVNREVWLGLGSGSFFPENTTSIFAGRQTGYEGLNRKDDQFTPRVSVAYEATPNTNLYASYSEGFKAGGFDPRARGDLDPLGLSQEGFAPEKVKSYEVGMKGSAADGRLTYAIAAFLADYTDQQITVQSGADSDNDGTNDTFVSSVFNAGSSTYKGVEIESAFRATDNLTLTAMMGYIDAEIDEIVSAGVNIADQFVTQNTPELQARLGFAYEYPETVYGGSLQFNGAAEYRSEYYLFNVPNPGFDAGDSVIFPAGGPALDPDEYTLLNLSANWTSSDDRYRIGLHGRNLTQEEYRVAAYNFVTPSQLGLDSAYSAFYGAPRTVTATFEYRY
ncbi:TonB-dependent receptor [Parvularcula sp. LCG005]|uniref:TonB-dependent receptor n=1 Tax=Parvularcula sp. LCG005 TaxID=3078805 RepID=UPI002943B470|nr:TonB-dependent receptor [Parvularcula sp. LCG005]WOI52154.1 TonB-dependent receptor [Parvularcula sp. LCG005]